MVSLVNSHTNATSKRQHLWEIDLRFDPGLPPGWEFLRGGVGPALEKSREKSEKSETHSQVAGWMQQGWGRAREMARAIPGSSPQGDEFLRAAGTTSGFTIFGRVM